MAKYDVKFNCGHVETIQLYGKETDRQRRIAWLEEHGECSACYKARIAAEHAAETAAAKAAEENLPELTGSEKQVNWALSIRAKKFADLDKMLADMTTTDEQLRRKNQIAIQATKNVLASKTESRFWIDNRNVEARKLIAANNLQDELKAEFARLTAEASATEVDADEYAVSTEAQEVAVDAEIELATATNTTDEINIDDATYRTILLHAEKISNGQNSFAAVLKNELRNLLNVDASELIEAIKTDSNYLNRVRCYLADYPLVITNDEGTRYHLVKLADDCCELDIINDEPEPPIEQEENTMTDADRTLAERKTMTRRELFLEAKKEVGYKFNARGAKIWYISYPRYDIHTEEYVGHTPALKRTRKDVEIYLRDDYCGLTVDDFLAEQEMWIDEETTKAINQMNIDDQAEHFADKVVREAKACDDNDDVFSHLPELDELDDVENFDDELILPTCVVDEKIYFTPIGNEFCNITVVDEYVHFFNGKLFLIRSPKYRARWQDGYFYANLGDIVKPCDSAEEFFAEMSKRGACTIDAPEPPVDDFGAKLAELQAKRDAAQEDHEAAENALKNFLTDTAADLTTKLQSLKLDYRIKLVKTLDWTFDPSLSVNRFNNVHIEWYYVSYGVVFGVENGIDTPLASYDTPAQVGAVINRLRAAIERGETEFKFPTVDELTTTRKAA